MPVTDTAASFGTVCMSWTKCGQNCCPLAASIGRRNPVCCCFEGQNSTAFREVCVGIHRVLSTQSGDLDTAYACFEIDL